MLMDYYERHENNLGDKKSGVKVTFDIAEQNPLSPVPN